MHRGPYSSPTMTGLRVLIVADDPLARAGLATMVADEQGHTVAGQTGSDAGIPALLDVYQPDVLLWDLGWDPGPSLDRLADLQGTDIPVVALLPDETNASEALAAGARGVLLRDTDGAVLPSALSAVAAGLVVLDSTLAPAVPPADSGPPSPPAEPLTSRESQVLRLMAEGLPNKAIAHRLDISEHTVKFHVNSILAKLSAQSRTEAVVRATRQGLIPL